MDTSPLKSMWLLGAIGLGAAVLLAGVYQLTKAPIEREQARQALQTLHQVLPAESYDNELAQDKITARIHGLAGESTIYRARLSGEPVAVVMKITTEEGYSGPIDLMVGIMADGRVSGVRVLAHRETPGLGDAIEVERSDWIFGFDGRALGDPEAASWRASRRGGEFDTLTSATITTEAIIVAVRHALEYFDAHREALF